MVDPEHRLFGNDLGELGVQLHRGREVLAERLLQDDRASGRQSRMMQRRHGRAEDRRRQREVGGDRPVAGNRGGHGGRIGDICPVVVRRRHHGAPRPGREFSGVAIELSRCPIAELLVVPVLPAHADQLERVTQMRCTTKRSEAR